MREKVGEKVEKMRENNAVWPFQKPRKILTERFFLSAKGSLSRDKIPVFWPFFRKNDY